MSFTPPTVAQFKAQFFRDFPYSPNGDPSLEYIQDLDIQNAIAQAMVNFNSGLFGDSALLASLFLCAHVMVMNIRTSSAGLGALAKFAMDSSSVGGVTIVNNINERFKDDPLFSGYLTTGYGKIYLDMAYPFTVGNVGLSCGQTTAA